MRATFAGVEISGTNTVALTPSRSSREGDRRAVVAARSRGATDGRRGAGEEIVEGAARLERAGMLKALELKRQRRGAGDRGGGFKERRAPDVAGDPPVRRPDVVGRHGGRSGGVFSLG